MWFAKLEGISGDISLKTKKNIRTLLSQVLSKAVAWSYIDNNPINGTEKIRIEEEEMKFWTKEEREDFLKSVAKTDKKYFPLFATLLFTGMRVGELFALQWKNVDLKRKIIHIRENYVDGEVRIPKSKKTRSVQICDFLVQVLKKHKEQADRYSLVFHRGDGSYLSNSMIRRPFLRNIELSEVERIRIHDLRHTFASLSLMQGVDVVSIQKWLGHKDLATTMRYVKVRDEFLRAESQKLGNGLDLSNFF